MLAGVARIFAAAMRCSTVLLAGADPQYIVVARSAVLRAGLLLTPRILVSQIACLDGDVAVGIMFPPCEMR